MPDQRSLLDQLKTLVIVADQHGLYGAADYLRARVTETEAKIAPRPRVEREQASTRGERSRKTKETANSLAGWADIIMNGDKQK